MSNVVALKDFRDRKLAEQSRDFSQSPEIRTYRAAILRLTKEQLLDEMVRFQEQRRSIGFLTREMMHQGIILFSELEKVANSKELQILSRSYRRHLAYELVALDGDAG